MNQSLKQKLQAGSVVRVFALARAIHPVVVEMYGLAGGYDGFWFDHEHGGATVEEMRNGSLAARACGLDCFARVPPVGYWLVTQCFEAGAGGVMGAQIQSAEQAREFVSWCKFAPEGTRGLNSCGRDAAYTHLPPAQFVERANRDHFVAIQIETLGALDEVDAIARLDGVDLVFLGPADMSLALGIVGQYEHERFWEAVRSIATACRNAGIAWGTLCPTPSYAERAAELDCRLFSIGNDVLALRRGIESIQATFTSVFS